MSGMLLPTPPPPPQPGEAFQSVIVPSPSVSPLIMDKQQFTYFSGQEAAKPIKFQQERYATPYTFTRLRSFTIADDSHNNLVLDPVQVRPSLYFASRESVDSELGLIRTFSFQP